MRMKIGLTFFPINPGFLFPLAPLADELGYESIWVGEHVVIPAETGCRHPYAPELGPPLPGTPLYDPLIVYGYIAGQTRRLRLGTSIYLLALRHPVMAARLAATLDIISGGRLILGVGAGWLREEFEVQDIPWERRGARMDEAIAVMRRLWSEESVAHEGDFYNFPGVGFAPKPIGGAVPIHIGGDTPPALRRAARTGDGWIGVTCTPGEAAEKVRQLHAMRESGQPLEITVTCEAIPTLDEVLRFRDAGVDRLTFGGRLLSGGGRTIEAMTGGLRRFGEDVIARLAG